MGEGLSISVPLLAEIWTFMRRHWLHVLFCLPGAILVTVLHESAHAFAAWAQGGRLLEFAWLPWASHGHWGYVEYDFPMGAVYSSFAISIAPYVLWSSLAGLAYISSWLWPNRSFACASTLYFWLYFVPLADIANTALPYALGRDNDFRQAFGRPSLPGLLALVLSALLAVWIGFGVQRRLYGRLGLRKKGYAVLCAAFFAFLIIFLSA